MAEIDLQDGELDGRVRKASIVECEKCERKLNKKHPRCIYCGTLNAQDPFRR